jgi:hypothetical protein
MSVNARAIVEMLTPSDMYFSENEAKNESYGVPFSRTKVIYRTRKKSRLKDICEEKNKTKSEHHWALLATIFLRYHLCTSYGRHAFMY